MPSDGQQVNPHNCPVNEHAQPLHKQRVLLLLKQQLQLQLQVELSRQPSELVDGPASIPRGLHGCVLPAQMQS
jgi:hypothetical protein